jgi:hypothetical protein
MISFRDQHGVVPTAVLVRGRPGLSSWKVVSKDSSVAEYLCQ